MDREGQREVHDNNTKQGFTDDEYVEEANGLADMNAVALQDKLFTDEQYREALEIALIEAERQLMKEILGFIPGEEE